MYVTIILEVTNTSGLSDRLGRTVLNVHRVVMPHLSGTCDAILCRMKTLLIPLFLVALTLNACRGGGGPATRVGRGVDHAFSKVGQGVQKAGNAIQDTAN